MSKELKSIFIYNKNETAINVNFFNSNIYLTQKQIADLFGTSRTNITKHIKNIYDSLELAENATSEFLELVTRRFKKLYQEAGLVINLPVES